MIGLALLGSIGILPLVLAVLFLVWLNKHGFFDSDGTN